MSIYGLFFHSITVITLLYFTLHFQYYYTMTIYTFKIKHDNGNYKLSVVAASEDIAKEMICKAEKCPLSALQLISANEQLYKVIWQGRVSNRRKILRKGLTENEAKRVVNSYPDSTRSIVYFQRH